MKRILISLAVAAQVPLMFWLGGGDFTARGFGIAYAYFCFLTTAICTYFTLTLFELTRN